MVIGEAEDKGSAQVCWFSLFSSALLADMLIQTLVLLSAVRAKLMLKCYFYIIVKYVLVAAEQISKRVARWKWHVCCFKSNYLIIRTLKFQIFV